jgi:hypothetical protein
MSDPWLLDYLFETERRNLCTRVFCFCRATEFREGLQRALMRATRHLGVPADEADVQRRILHGLADVEIERWERGYFDGYIRCILYHAAKAIGEPETARILGDSWGGEMFRRMQLHHRAVLAEGRRRAEYDAPQAVEARRNERLRQLQLRHQDRQERKRQRDQTVARASPGLKRYR